MLQFDVYANPYSRSRELAPYVVDIQAQILSDLNTHVVIPLYRKGVISPLRGLNPEVEIEGETLVLFTQDMAGTSRQKLKKVVVNLSHRRDDIIAAIDLLITGI